MCPGQSVSQVVAGCRTRATRGAGGCRRTLVARCRPAATRWPRSAALTARPEPGSGIGFGKRVGDSTSVAVERITDVAKQESLLAKLDQIDRALAKLDGARTADATSAVGRSVRSVESSVRTRLAASSTLPDDQSAVQPLPGLVDLLGNQLLHHLSLRPAQRVQTLVSRQR